MYLYLFVYLFVEFYRWFNFRDELRSETKEYTSTFRLFSRTFFFLNRGNEENSRFGWPKLVNHYFLHQKDNFQPIGQKIFQRCSELAILFLPFTNHISSAHGCSLSWFVSRLQTLFFFLTQLKFNIHFRQLNDTFVLENSHCKIFVQTQCWALRVQTELKTMQGIQTTLVTLLC